MQIEHLASTVEQLTQHVMEGATHEEALWLAVLHAELRHRTMSA